MLWLATCNVTRVLVRSLSFLGASPTIASRGQPPACFARPRLPLMLSVRARRATRARLGEQSELKVFVPWNPMVKRLESSGLPLLPPVRRRSKRLEKKLRIGDFKEYGFAVGFRLSESLTPTAGDDFWSRFIGNLIEERGLAFGGSEEGFITKFGRGSATEDDRTAVSHWLKNQPEVERVVVGPLEDAWYGHAEGAP